MVDNSVHSEGTPFPPEPPQGDPASPLERLASFRFTYLAIFLFLLCYVLTVKGVEALLLRHFEASLAAAAVVDPGESRVIARLQDQIDGALRRSPWIRPGGVRVTPIVLGADGRTLIYAAGGPVAPPPLDEDDLGLDDESGLLPVSIDVVLSVPHNALVANAILMTYFAILVTTLLVYTRRLTRREAQQIEQIRGARDEVAARARGIQGELEAVRGRLSKLEPERERSSSEVRALEQERLELLGKLAEVEQREQSLRASSHQTHELEEERTALEELLEEALGDLEHRDEEIQNLQRQVKQVRNKPAAPRARESDLLGKRLRTLYKTLEFDDRAIQDVVGLRDETMKLKAEESLKRLAEDADNTAIRRKVGGLPPHLSIFELGFAGKGRLYYTRGRQRRFRILLVGAKNSQKPDLEYLSRLPRE